jgi:hypothetical protein
MATEVNVEHVFVHEANHVGRFFPAAAATVEL